MKPTLKRVSPPKMMTVDGEQVAIVVESTRQSPQEAIMFGFRRNNVGVSGFRRIDGGKLEFAPGAEYRPAYRAAVQYAEGMAKEAGQVLGVA